MALLLSISPTIWLWRTRRHLRALNSTKMMMRLMLLLKSAHDVTWGFSLAAAFIWGLVFDLGAALCWLAPLALLLAGMGMIEYLHHDEHGPEHVAKLCNDPADAREAAKVLFQQHLYSHR